MKKLKFILVLNSLKLFQITIKIFFKNKGTNLPGSVALKIMPKFLNNVVLPNKIIGVTGTNGKTSTSNMINDILKDNGYTTVNNSKGSNLKEGIVSSIIESSNIFGKVKRDVAIFEIDERASRYVFEDIKPNILICTNLFRDSIKRNGHSEFILEKLKEKLPKESLLILNADDLISVNIRKSNEAIYFSVIGNKDAYNDIVRDVRLCPKCNGELLYDYRHYHHIGRVNCSQCSFKSPKSDFIVTKIDKDNNLFIIKENNNKYVYELLSSSIYNIYNMVGVIATLRAFGLTHDLIYNSFKNVNFKKDRIDKININNKFVTTMLTKNQNPISCSRSFEYIKNEPLSKTVILLITDSKDKKHKSEDTSWIYDADFEYLNDKNIDKIIVAGSRYIDITIRLQLAGIKPKTIIAINDYKDLRKEVKNINSESIIILYELYAYSIATKLKRYIIRELGSK